MSKNTKTAEFLKKLAPCIERGDLDACVEEAARVAREMGVGAEELMELSEAAGLNGRHDFTYALALAAAQGLEGDGKAIAHYNAGLSAQFLKKVEKAEEHYKLAIAANLNLSEAHSNYAILLKELNRKPEAEEHYKLAIAVNLNYAAVHYNYANFLSEVNRKPEAEEHYKLAIAANPNDAEAHCNYANLLSEVNRKPEAEEHYKLAIAANPNYAEAHYNYANLLSELNRKPEAEVHYKLTIAANPNLVEGHSNYAILLKELNRKPEAEEHYKLAIAANPNYAEGQYNYAILLSELNRKPEAEKHYKQAIAANPNCAEAHSNYANLLSELNRKPEAEEHYKLAIAANPNFIEAHGAYGLFLIESEQREKSWEETKIASDLFQKALRFTESQLAKAWFYQRYADKNLERNRYKESSEDIIKAGEEYLKASETVEGEIRHALELKGNVCKAQSFIRKEHKNNQELVNDLKNASEFYKKASVCPAGGTEETCDACYSVMEVFSQALTALEGVVHNKKPTISKEEWNVKLEKSKEVYIKKGSEKGTALVSALKELIKCVDELAYYTARKSSLQKKRLKECYKTLEDVSLKVEGGLKNITDPANEILKNYAREMGVPMPEEKALDESPSPFYEKLIKPIVVAIITIVLGYITNLLFEWKTHATIWNFIKSTIFNQTLP